VESWGQAALASLAGSCFAVEPGLARALTHGFHSYAGRMHPGTARRAIAALTKPGQRVLDPFCGSGTVLVEAMAAGRAATGVDASPLAVLIAKVRSTVLDAAERARLVATAAQISEAAAERARRRIRPEIPSWAARERERFFPHVALELLGLRELVGQTAEDEVGYALRASLSSILVKFMRQGPGVAEGGPGQRIGRGVPSQFFASRATELARALAALADKTPAGTRPPEIRSGDARHLDSLSDGIFHLVLSSPPYAGTYDYAEHHDVRFLWLGLPRAGFDSVQVGARTEILGSPAKRWRNDRRQWLGEMARVVRRGGSVVLVVGDGVVGTEPEDAAAAIATLAPKAGLELLAGASQSRPPHDRRLDAIFAGHPRREHVLILRREG
jgi:DNA modification methylase